jgi:tripeptide aminopeptidase
MKVDERFLDYVHYDTQSDHHATCYPSTAKQLVLLKHLKAELETFGVPATIDEHGYVIGTLAGNAGPDVPAVALIAHVDTSPDASGANIKPRIVRRFDGRPIALDASGTVRLDPAVFPWLADNVGQDLIVTDGTTLLGADDKAGVAEIMTVIERLTTDPSLRHGTVKIVFTPDEEVGNGTLYLDPARIGADYGYTLDGSRVGEIAYENFNAAGVVATFRGKSVHPGAAKNKMVNSIRLAAEFDALLPLAKRPELTEKYEGFNHPTEIKGTCEETVVTYIVRNHDVGQFDIQKAEFRTAAAFIDEKYGPGTCVLDIREQYLNMRSVLEKRMEIVDLALAAIRKNGVEPIIEPIRGGTDGARLTYMGLPCPNLGTGGYNYHGPYEYASINEMEKTVEIVLTLLSDIAAGR